MESFFAKKEYNYSTEFASGSNKIDLTLKLSPCGEDPEERRLKRSSSSMVGNGAEWGPFVASLDRSCSLPSEAEAEAEKGLVRFGELQTIRRAETGKRMLLQRQSGVTKHDEGGSYIPYIAQQPSAEGVLDRNIQKPPTKPENPNTMVNSNKTMMPKGITTPPRPTPDATNKVVVDIPSNRFKLGNYCSLKGDVMEILRQMPSVTTKGDGPNGKRIEGFLYKYMNGEVCIVCVCHGNFFTPAEFIVHAGGKEVENPMKHITVFTNSF